MLSAAGVSFEAVRPHVDEDALKAGLHAEPDRLAAALASAKAASIEHGDDWVIGSDSVVSVDGRQFDKPASREQAAEHLRFFSGKAMRLTSAVALARAGTEEWAHSDSATLQVRPLSEAFIDDYLDAEWPEVGYCVGVFRMEARGVQLFEAIDGDYFTILGMPLLPLLRALRQRDLILA